MFLKPTKAAVLVEDYIFRNDLAVTISGDPIEPIMTDGCFSIREDMNSFKCVPVFAPPMPEVKKFFQFCPKKKEC